MKQFALSFATLLILTTSSYANGPNVMEGGSGPNRPEPHEPRTPERIERPHPQAETVETGRGADKPVSVPVREPSPSPTPNGVMVLTGRTVLPADCLKKHGKVKKHNGKLYCDMPAPKPK